ncbi:MAG: restriction endonuclease subunit S domain-containing protein [Leptospirillum sp.]|jgi:type I restriction enzyme S subunit
MSYYKPYPAYKNSGVEWIGEVPEHWGVKPIKIIASCNEDSLPESIPPDTPIRYVDISAVSHDEGIAEAVPIVFGEAPSRARRKAKSGDVVVSTVRTYLKAVASVDDAHADCVYSTGFAVLRARSVQLAPEFLKWLALNDLFIQAVESHSEGLSYPAINSSELVNLKTVVPGLPEQKRIASVLDCETARIDALITKKTRFIELLKEKRSALITHAVTKGMDPSVKMKDSGVEWIGEVPEHWEVKRIRHIAQFTNSNVDKKRYEGQQTVKLCNYTDVYYNEFITSNLPFMESTASPSEIRQFSLRKGDVIITKDSEDPRDIGIPAFVDDDMPEVICGYHLTVIRTNDTDAAGFVHRSLQSHPTKSHFFVESPGITRFGLSQDAIGDIVVSLPPKSERRKITSLINCETARIDALITKTQRSIALLKERHSAFITAAVTGQIDLWEST